MKFVFENDRFPEDVEHIKNNGFEIINCQYNSNGLTFSKELSGPFLFRGSVNLGKRINNQFEESVTFLYDNVYDCTSYMHTLGDKALNNPHFYVEAKLLDDVNKILNVDFFHKQNSVSKIITGGKYEFASSDFIPNELILLSNIKPISAEWRFCISNSAVLTASPYGSNIHSIPDGCIDFVNNVLNLIQDPAPIYFIDVCLCSGEFKIVSITPLLTSNWYFCDKQKILQELKRLTNDL